MKEFNSQIVTCEIQQDGSQCSHAECVLRTHNAGFGKVDFSDEEREFCIQTILNADEKCQDRPSDIGRDIYNVCVDQELAYETLMAMKDLAEEHGSI